MMPSWLTGRWAVGIAAWVASSFAVWFAGDTLALGGWRPLDAPGERVAFIAALAAAWLGWELLRARRTLQENARLLDGLVGGIADQDSASRAAHEIQVLRKRFEDALGVLRKARFRGADGRGTRKRDGERDERAQGEAPDVHEQQHAALSEERAQTEGALTEALQAARLMAAALSQESGRRHSLEARVSQLEQSLENHGRNVDLSTEESARALAENVSAFINEK